VNRSEEKGSSRIPYDIDKEDGRRKKCWRRIAVKADESQAQSLVGSSAMIALNTFEQICRFACEQKKPV